jgi:chemosensory pili system protein ChpC
MLGDISWRGRRIPVVSFELAAGAEAQDGARHRARIAVLNTPSGNEAAPYIGVLTLGISRLVRITAENLAADDEAEVISPLVHEAASINKQPVWIPNLDALEQLVAENR